MTSDRSTATYRRLLAMPQALSSVLSAQLLVLIMESFALWADPRKFDAMMGVFMLLIFQISLWLSYTLKVTTKAWLIRERIYHEFKHLYTDWDEIQTFFFATPPMEIEKILIEHERQDKNQQEGN